MDCLNFGKSGAGNDYISAKLIDVILEEKKENIGLVVLMWTNWQRIDPWYQTIEGKWRAVTKSKRIGTVWDNTLEYNNTYNATAKALRHFLVAQMLLKDIPYLMIQGINAKLRRLSSINGRHKDLWSFTLLDSKIFDEIDEKKFIGWPVMHDIGGYAATDILDKIDPERNQLRISDQDSHPNAKGHRIITQEIYNAYEKNYL
jgi:hypothetical protein